MRSNKIIIILMAASIALIYFILNSQYLITTRPSIAILFLMLFVIIFLWQFTILIIKNDSDRKQTIKYVIVFAGVFGYRLLSNPLTYDDWTYSRFGGFGDSLFQNLNDHWVPLFNFFIISLDQFFIFSTIKYSFFLFTINALLLIVLIRACIYFELNSFSRSVIAFLFIFASPFLFSRFWFGGGYWFTLGTFIFISALPTVDMAINSLKPKLIFYSSILMAGMFLSCSLFRFSPINFAPLFIPRLISSSRRQKLLISLCSLSAVMLLLTYHELDNFRHLFGNLESNADLLNAIKDAVYKIYHRVSPLALIGSVGEWIASSVTYSLVPAVGELMPTRDGLTFSHHMRVDIRNEVGLLVSAAVFPVLFWWRVFVVRSFCQRSKLFDIALFNFIFFFLAVSWVRGEAQITQGYYAVFPFLMLCIIVGILLADIRAIFGVVRTRYACLVLGAVIAFTSISNSYIFHNPWGVYREQQGFAGKVGWATCSALESIPASVSTIVFDIDEVVNYEKVKTVMSGPDAYFKDFSLYPILATRFSQDVCPGFEFEYSSLRSNGAYVLNTELLPERWYVIMDEFAIGLRR